MFGGVEMSRNHMKKVHCPDCKKEYEIQMWDSITGDLNREEKRNILNGEFGRNDCPFCGRKNYFVYPFLYHDMNSKCMIGLQCNYGNDFLEKYAPEGYRFRIVDDMAHLAEKIAIFDSGLNDLIVETTKYIVSNILQLKSGLLFLSLKSDKLEFVDEENPINVISVPKEMYQEAYDLFDKKDLQEKLIFVKVDRAYIESMT